MSMQFIECYSYNYTECQSESKRHVKCVHRVRRSTVDEAKSLACSVDEHNIPFDAGITYVSIVDMDTMTD